MGGIPSAAIREGERRLTDQEMRTRIGQIFLVGFNGNKVQSEGFQALLKIVRKGQIGGVMFLKGNISSRNEVKAMIAHLQQAAPAGLPLFVAVDQEGGLVQRLTPDNAQMPYTNSAQKLGANGAEAARVQYDTLARNLAALGFNLNFGPVVDVNTNSNNPVIAKLKRSYSSDPNQVTQFASIFIEAHRKHGVMTALKHFPGHGSSANDSHNGFVDISKSWSNKELMPYMSLISSNKADTVMVGHLYNAQLDGNNNAPATLSEKTIQKTLRMGLNFNGLVISDDMYMGAIRKHYKKYDAMLQAIRAGNDILIYSAFQTDEQITAMINKVLEFAHKEPALATRINQTYQRITSRKQRLSLSRTISPAPVSLSSISGKAGDVDDTVTGSIGTTSDEAVEIYTEDYILWTGKSVTPIRPQRPMILESAFNLDTE